VAIAFFIKDGSRKGKLARVRQADQWGLRQGKYDWLLNHDVETTDWQEISPKPEFYLFLPRDEAALEQYNEFVKVTEVFPVHSLGFQTHRDRFVTDFDKEILKRRIRMFLDLSLPDELVRQAFKLKDNRDWKMPQKRKKIQEDEKWEERITQCLYRPFDIRWIFYHYHAIDFGREAIMQHMLAGDNLCLLVPRQTSTVGWSHVIITKRIAESCVVSNKTREQNYNFPLYLYPDTSKKDLFSDLEPDERKPNLNPKVVAALTAAYGEEPTPEDIFYYVYAVLYADTYREKYAEFLKIDFPRVPFTADFELFQTLAALGRRLVNLHLLQPEELDPPVARFQGQGDNRVARTKSQGFRYEPREERIYINKTQYFAPVPLELWEYQIGGYQVLEKWLKDRRDRQLSLEEIKIYCRVVTAIRHTIALQEEIDALYPEAEKILAEGVDTT